MRVTWAETGQLTIREVITPRAAQRRGVTAEHAIPDYFLQSPSVIVEKTLEVSLKPDLAALRRGTPLPVIALQVETTGDEAALVVLRHPSGAITFHPSISSSPARRGAGTAGSVQLFHIPVRQAQTPEGRRNIVTKAIKAVVLKVAKPAIDKVVDFALPKLAHLWEVHTWNKHNLATGWLRVVAPQGGGALQLQPAVPDSANRNLLLIHGTFSNAASAYGSLTQTDFFDKMRTIYEDRIFAFNHFTVSESPEKNAEDLLAALPDRKQSFDVVTHSRGGLVLRTLVERALDLGAAANRFQLGRAVLVASPNDGTPLATPDRWDKTVGWFANLMEIVDQFAPNPFVTGAEFVSEAIVWLAHHILGDLPGLSSMDAGGATVGALQAPPAPPAHSYSALVANFNPDHSLLQRMIDAGVDQFFLGANDLVVPSEGGWRVDHDGMQNVDVTQIGCFGPGGNLATSESSPVMHTSFFVRQETAAFLTRALSGQPQNLPVIDPGKPLPDRRFVRAFAASANMPPSTPPSAPAPKPQIAPGTQGKAFVSPSTSAPDTFHLTVIDVPRSLQEEIAAGRLDIDDAAKRSAEQNPTDSNKQRQDGSKKVAMLYAAYGGARAIVPFGLSGGAAGRRFENIINFHRRIKNFTDKQQGTLPGDKEMIQFGALLFETLFPGNVKRLYDTARSLQRRGKKMDLVFTSTLSWVAELPWEFAYDPGRKSFLGTEEIHFVRQVITLVPGDALEPRVGPLKILVVSAQPVGLAQLSLDQETEVIKSGFQPLIQAGASEVDVLPRATVPALHGYLTTGKYNILHYIGHGEFDEKKQTGYLVLEDGRGGASLLDERSAREIFCGRGLDLIFLNACQTSATNPSDFNKGLAQALVSKGIPAVVANQYSVLDVSATSFARFFYFGLANGLSFGAAAREARVSVNYSINGDPIDWAVPVLYARDPNNFLVQTSRPQTATGTVAQPSSYTKTRGIVPPETAAQVVAGPAITRQGAPAAEVIRIAVWDVDCGLPSLKSILEKLNLAQARFIFECVNLSAPLDTFEAHDGNKVLRAERLARRLSGRPSELNVNYLVCITAHPMVDEKGRRVFEWSPTNALPVLVLSYAAFRQLDPYSVDVERALTNAIVAVLAAARARLVRHDKPPLDCPLYLGKKPRFSALIAEQRFDPECRKQLQRIIAADLSPLEAMLRVFDRPKNSRHSRTIKNAPLSAVP